MSKRLIRIYPEHVLSRLEKAIGLEINAVMQNGKTYFGKIMSFTADGLNINDTRNHLHHLLLSDLYEIVYDLESPQILLHPE